ncbi:DUF2690 domain-containing protein [Streptomyces sp. CA2R106]|uniref:DUF2690 domain-containing protein n=1 Tax=Streptomyces sp. CA2R106 TaxID=3120153 RepID=UPI003008FCE1
MARWKALPAELGPAPCRRVARPGGPRLLLTVVVSAALGCGVTAVVLRAQPAKAAAARATPSATTFHVGCTSSACDGRDPGTMLCGVEPETLLQTQTPAGAGAEIRYNPLCRAAWARL